MGVRVDAFGALAPNGERLDVGESPVWSPQNDALHWIDIVSGDLLTARDGKVTRRPTPGPTGCVALGASGGLIVATAAGILLLDESGQHLVADPIRGRPGMRYNDGKVDAAGRLWVGTMRLDGSGGGALFVVDGSGRVTRVLDDLLLPNGLGWSPGGDVFYHVDSNARTITAFDCDDTGTTLSNRRVIRRYDGSAKPDGMTIDAEGRLWVALWDGGAIDVLAPDGAREARLSVPVARPTSCTFGGKDLGTLFVTTAARGDTASLAGAVLCLQTVGNGLASCSFQMNTAALRPREARDSNAGQ